MGIFMYGCRCLDWSFFTHHSQCIRKITDCGYFHTHCDLDLDHDLSHDDQSRFSTDQRSRETSERNFDHMDHQLVDQAIYNVWFGLCVSLCGFQTLDHAGLGSTISSWRCIIGSSPLYGHGLCMEHIDTWRSCLYGRPSRNQ